ncbi:MAG: hypothetical protein WC860_08130, partial [Candidatus Margulisiibacteriota bacterium]
GFNFLAFFDNFVKIVTTEWLFSLILFISLIFLVIKVFFNRNKKIKENPMEYYLILGCVLAQLLQLLIVSKHYMLRYMVPGFLLSGPILVFLLYYAQKITKFNKQYFSIIVFLIFFSIFVIKGYQSIIKLKSIEQIVNVEQSRIPANFGQNQALNFGNFWSGQKYTAKIKGYLK